MNAIIGVLGAVAGVCLLVLTWHVTAPAALGWLTWHQLAALAGLTAALMGLCAAAGRAQAGPPPK